MSAELPPLALETPSPPAKPPCRRFDALPAHIALLVYVLILEGLQPFTFLPPTSTITPFLIWQTTFLSDYLQQWAMIFLMLWPTFSGIVLILRAIVQSRRQSQVQAAATVKPPAITTNQAYSWKAYTSASSMMIVNGALFNRDTGLSLTDGIIIQLKNAYLRALLAYLVSIIMLMLSFIIVIIAFVIARRIRAHRTRSQSTDTESAAVAQTSEAYSDNVERLVDAPTLSEKFDNLVASQLFPSEKEETVAN